MKLLDTSAVIDIDRGGVDGKVRTLDEHLYHECPLCQVFE